MTLAPEGLLPLVAFALILGGTAFIVLSRTPKAYGLALLSLAVFFLQNLDPPTSLVFDLGLRTTPFLAGAQWWTPLTYMFLHADIWHVLGNLVILVAAGPALEDRVGPRWFLLVYFLAGFAAAGAHVVLTAYDVVGNGPAVGASGAIFGVLTAFAVRYPREPLPTILGFFVITLPAFLLLLIHLGLNLVFMLGDTNIAWWGHFAGYLVGLPAAVLFEKRKVDVTVARKEDIPDVEKLRPLATTREMGDMLDKAAKFGGDHASDATFANAWVDRFIQKARCPHDGAPLARDGFVAYCPHGDYRVEFARKA